MRERHAEKQTRRASVSSRPGRNKDPSERGIMPLSRPARSTDSLAPCNLDRNGIPPRELYLLGEPTWSHQARASPVSLPLATSVVWVGCIGLRTPAGLISRAQEARAPIALAECLLRRIPAAEQERPGYMLSWVSPLKDPLLIRYRGAVPLGKSCFVIPTPPASPLQSFARLLQIERVSAQRRRNGRREQHTKSHYQQIVHFLIL